MLIFCWRILYPCLSGIIIYYFLCFHSVFDFDIRVMPCRMSLKAFHPSPSVFWNSLRRIGIKIPFFYPLTFCVILDVKWVLWWKHVNGACFPFNPLSHPIFWISTFSPFTFKVIIDRHVLITMLLVVFWLFLVFFSVPFFSESLMIWLLSYVCVTSSLSFVYLLHVFDSWLPWSSYIINISIF